jgi:hypothetical protein
MQNTFSFVDENYLQAVRDYLKSKINTIVYALIFILVFFQFYPYSQGMFILFGYLFSYIAFSIYILLQVLQLVEFNDRRPILLIYFYFICWLFWCLITTYITTNHDYSFNFLNIKMLYFCTFYVVSQFLVSEERIKNFEYIILICVIFNFIHCIVEFVTLKHTAESIFAGKFHYIPTGAFFNQNDFPSAFLLVMPVFLFVDKDIFKHLGPIITFFFAMIVFITQTRLVAFSFYPFWLFQYVFKTKWLFKLLSIFTLIMIIYAIFTLVPGIKKISTRHFNYALHSFEIESKTQYLGSTQVRKKLYFISFDKFLDSKGLGIGTGRFAYSNTTDEFIETGYIEIPHNLFAEILATEGIPGFTFLCLIVFSPLFCVMNSIKKKSFNFIKECSKEHKMVLVFTYFFLFATACPSSVNKSNFIIIWTLLAYYYSILYSKNESI